jgi:hypothetical protein
MTTPTGRTHHVKTIARILTAALVAGILSLTAIPAATADHTPPPEMPPGCTTINPICLPPPYVPTHEECLTQLKDLGVYINEQGEVRHFLQQQVYYWQDRARVAEEDVAGLVKQVNAHTTRISRLEGKVWRQQGTIRRLRAKLAASR